MKDKQPKYPMSLFWMGFFLNFIKNILLLLPGVILLIVGIWVKWCLVAGLCLLALDLILALAEQLRLRHAALNSDDPNFKEWQEAMLSPDWKDNVIELVEDEAEEPPSE